MSAYGRRILDGFITGLIFSTFVAFSSPKFHFFLVFPTLAQLLYSGLFFVALLLLISWLVCELSSRLRNLMFCSATTLLFVFWCLSSARWSDWSVVYGTPVTLLAGSILFLTLLTLTRKSSWSNTWLAGVVILIGVLRLVPITLPTTTLSRTVHVDRSNSWGDTVFNSLVTPFSIPVDQAVNRYPFLFGKVPAGRKIFVIVFDAFRQDYVGTSKNGIKLTPNLEQIGQKNFQSQEYRVQAPRTKASVASFFTGKYVREHGTYRFGLVDNIGKKPEERPNPAKLTIDDYYGHALPKKFRTLAERLNSKGFQNAGITTIGHLNPKYNYDQGFHIYLNPTRSAINQDLFTIRMLVFWLLRSQPARAFSYVHLPGGHFPYIQGKKNTQYWKKTDYFKDGELSFDKWGMKPLEDLTQRSVSQETFNNNQPTVDFIRHLYASSINYYDLFYIPRLVSSLKTLGIYDSSFTVFTADHGENLFDYKGFYGHGRTLREVAINVPLVIKLPNIFSGRNVSNTNTSTFYPESIDLTATILNYAGASRSGVSGESFLNRLKPGRSSKENHKVSFSEQPGNRDIFKAALVKDNKKLIHRYANQTSQLFMISKGSPGETPLQQPELLSNYRNFLFEHFGKDNTFQDTSAPLVGLSREELKRLRGLGYLGKP